jgi:hypothetical protein
MPMNQSVSPASPASLRMKRSLVAAALAAALAAAAFACSSAEPAGGVVGGPAPTAAPTSTVPNEGEPGIPISPEEQAPYNADEVCASQCAVDFASTGPAAQLLQDLDDCNVEQCYGDEADDDPTTKSCAAIGAGAGQITYGLVERDRCLSRSCCAQAQACAGNAGCSSLASCIERCQVRN